MQLAEQVLGGLGWRTLHDHAPQARLLLPDTFLCGEDELVGRGGSLRSGHGSLQTPVPDNGFS
jgi:hypothetical protein